MVTPTPPQQPQGINPLPPPPQWIPDPTGVYRKVVGAPSPFDILNNQGAVGAPVSEEMGSPGGLTDAVTRRMQRNEDQARRQEEQPPSPIASQSY